ncbi:molybdopterin-dependent oxidoreductase [Phaeobacter gallaeciensis]|uniref:xanthine dehydrogenase family protein molybdopterin-binding subunit n=1 Tax=Phaeobacter TaxID=302485 RepID=UPI0023805EB6|nr:molybdopterin cofactor-binding domain-containing protein [Phaeobacter gallaeciensis]MDE4275493.1 molybdopterin-dependent oxidoreductase [Phaeobacter gallaeciensis]MDE4300756.1 molybdopterin-dependent oxidoreductase [Phaeobacter gallaeciensis]MDE5185920.1 molybdopterin-dependent oxidoreductase [Phaeobacter gallaeciensis]
MASFKKIARRSFLIGSAAIFGGVAFGTYKYHKPAPNPLSPKEGQAALNPFVMVDQSGVTLVAPRAEMGQGVRTSWVALIAEELDVRPEAVQVIHGPAAKAYYNSAMMAEALPGRGYDASNFQHSLGQIVGHMSKFLDLQVTGGSSSMKDGFDRMRMAGATARETLKEAAAQRLGTSRALLDTEDGHVIAPDGSRIPYTDLAVEAAGIDPQEAELRPAAQWKYVGKDMPRLDMVPKVTGTAGFGVDVRLEGMKFAAIRQSPHFGAGKTAFDASAAETMPGVEKVLDLGDAVAVVASNTWLAQQAVDAIDVTWEPAPYPETTDAIFAEIDRAFEDSSNSVLRDDGDVDSLPEGAQVIEAEYRLPYLAHATMEPMNATALYTGDALQIWAPNQGPTVVQKSAADLAGLPKEAVQVHTTYLGGGFGRRIEVDYTNRAVEIAMQMRGTPVQLTWSREEDMTHDFYRPGAVARYRAAVKDGKALMVHGKIAAQSTTVEGAGRMLGLPMGGPDKGHVDAAFNQPLAIPNFRVEGYLVKPMIPVGFWRSVAASFNGFFSDTILDEMAHAAGRDPLEFRLELARAEWEPAAKVLEKVREMSGWTGETPEGLGRGVALAYSFGTPVAEVIEVVDEDGQIRINKAWIAADIGRAIDSRNVEAQMFSGLAYGLSAACFGEITFADGAVEQQNFPDFDAMRMHSMPAVEVAVLQNQTHMGGAGEPGTPPAAPALANALFDLTGKRARRLPLMHEFDLLV